jgi:hypothetical protein
VCTAQLSDRLTEVYGQNSLFGPAIGLIPFEYGLYSKGSPYTLNSLKMGAIYTEQLYSLIFCIFGVP